jgi:uncharacterized protein
MKRLLRGQRTHRSARSSPWAFAHLACLYFGLAAMPAVAADLHTQASDIHTQAPDITGVVELETEGAVGGSARIAEDLASIVDDGATRRVLPVVGKSAQQNLIDLARLRGIDMAILSRDFLDSGPKISPGAPARRDMVDSHTERPTIFYITELFNQEIHVLARSEIKRIADLASQKVNVDARGSGTATTAARLFNLLGVQPQMTNYDQSSAIEKLRRGDIAALVFVTAKPAPLFQSIGREGLHFLSMPLETALINAYVPAKLEKADYPNIMEEGQSIDTFAVGTVLAVANLQPGSARYRNVANFADAFFTNFPSLLEAGHHPKWHEINLAATVPGLIRFPPAQQWLDRNANVASRASPEELKAQFSRFIDTRQEATGRPGMPQQQKQELFEQFQRWQAGQAH